MTTVAIMQPTYLPWAGYFDLIDQSDVFVLLDTVAVSPKSWQTRNRIRARDGNVVWLSVPTNARRGTPLNDVRTQDEHGWVKKHWRTLDAAYNHAPYYKSHVWDMRLFDIGHSAGGLIPNPHSTRSLVNLNLFGIVGICGMLGIDFDEYGSSTVCKFASQMGRLGSDPIQRIRNICRITRATELLNTPGAREWMEGHDVGVPVRWHQYEHPVYTQGDAPFCSHLSVVDLLAWHGPDSLRIIQSGRRDA